MTIEAQLGARDSRTQHRKHIVYVAELEYGSNVTYTPAEFAKKFNWKNDPSKARFLKLDDEK